MKQPTNIDKLERHLFDILRFDKLDGTQELIKREGILIEDLKQLAIRRCKALDSLLFLFRCDECGHITKHEDFFYKLRTNENFKCPKCKPISYDDITEMMHPWNIDMRKAELMRIFNIKPEEIK